MKKSFGKWMILAVLALTLTCTAVFAEGTAPEAAEAVQAPAAESAQTAAADTALEEAFKALETARADSRANAELEALKEELNGYVAAGKLTQEQADLILKYYTEQQSLRNGVCPGCGYQFGSDIGGRGGHGRNGYGRGNGGSSQRNGKGSWQNGGNSQRNGKGSWQNGGSTQRNGRGGFGGGRFNRVPAQNSGDVQTAPQENTEAAPVSGI